jgi:hypothetical protein
MRPLPPEPADLLRQVEAPPRLIAHHQLVHDVACELSDWMLTREVAFDGAAVRFGAATHDIGKVLHPEELSAPGTLHEAAGERLLLKAGVEPRFARFAATHGSWNDGAGLEDLLVSLADKVWKAKRVADLEQLVVDQLATASGQEPWAVFLELDDVLDALAADSDQRLAFQNSHPV